MKRRRQPREGLLLSRRVRRVVALVVAAAVLFGVVVEVANPFAASPRHFTVYFSRTTGLYTGDDVRVLGVHVGSVSSIHPEGTKVRVVIDVDHADPIPSGAKAAIVAPSLVSGRFIQLAPAYVSGPQLASGAVVDRGRLQAVPVEFDDVKQELLDLAKTLGPKGVGGSAGSLNQLIEVASANLGHGAAKTLHDSITSLTSAASALSSGSGDLFSTVANLDSFVHSLVLNDASLRSFSGQLDTFSGVLASDRTALSTAVDSLDGALSLVTKFLNDNTKSVSTTVSSLGNLAHTVAQMNSDLAGLLQGATFAANNFFNIIEYNGVNGRASVDNFQGAAGLVCGLVLGVGGSSQQCQESLEPLLNSLGISTLPILQGDTSKPSTGSTSSSKPVTPPPATSTAPANPVTNLLGLLLGGNR